jgi:hypothetical protein
MLPLGSLALGVHLSSTGSRLLLLLMILLLLEEEHNTWLWCSGPQLDCWVGMVRSVRVLSGGGVVVMGTTGVTTLHPRGPGKQELAPLPEVVLPSLEDSSRIGARTTTRCAPLLRIRCLGHSLREKDSGCLSGRWSTPGSQSRWFHLR